MHRATSTQNSQPTGRVAREDLTHRLLDQILSVIFRTRLHEMSGVGLHSIAGVVEQISDPILGGGSFRSNGTVKALIELDVILQGPKIGRNHSYRLNPQFGWKGMVNNHKETLTNGLSVIQGGRA
ncbi:hypothetical protein [Xenorhabdus bovienii]|uniref:hypothetical protein n=1 Tax=Xenorhabdus bovienii TaxID=40576 RepID=UPI0012D3063C|nr:hypothetical protein [Xenorhabdus bovienii]MDE9455164.1 hypothetical protein [Xenorhabdus bovienii]